MKRTDTVVIGGGQAGLAVSACLGTRGVDHVVLERGRVGESWRERWDSLRLLSPNWMTRLPGASLPAHDPEGFMAKSQVIRYLEDYAATIDAPVLEETVVRHVDPCGSAWSVATNRGVWIAANVVVATGHCQQTAVPRCARDLSPRIAQFTTSDYRNPEQLPPGGVLVVGASASGVQLAHELRESGREVVIAVGEHTRLPRRYRGRDILYWIDRTGAFDRPLSDMPDPEAARREPSLQLVGNDDGETLDLAVLAGMGVGLAGRLEGFDRTLATFSDDLGLTTADADAQLRRLLSRIDSHITSHGLEAELPPPSQVAPVPVAGAPLTLDLGRSGITSVLWATGYRRSYPWLHAPVFDARGEIRQNRGRTPAPGLYVIGLQFMIRRSSSFLHGVGRDAAEIADEIARRSRRTEAA